MNFPRVAHLACDWEGRDDWTIHNAITRELKARGFTVINRTDEKFDTCEGIAVRYFDNWTWDLSIYLDELRIRFIDGRTGDPIFTVSYQQGVFHGYPNSEDVIKNLFAEIDSKGFF